MLLSLSYRALPADLAFFRATVVAMGGKLDERRGVIATRDPTACVYAQVPQDSMPALVTSFSDGRMPVRVHVCARARPDEVAETRKTFEAALRHVRGSYDGGETEMQRDESDAWRPVGVMLFGDVLIARWDAFKEHMRAAQQAQTC